MGKISPAIQYIVFGLSMLKINGLFSLLYIAQTMNAGIISAKGEKNHDAF